MQTLAEYLDSTGTSQRAFAALVPVDPSVLSRYLSKRAKPGLSTALRIQRLTSGAVPVEVWDDEIDMGNDFHKVSLPDGVPVLGAKAGTTGNGASSAAFPTSEDQEGAPDVIA